MSEKTEIDELTQTIADLPFEKGILALAIGLIHGIDRIADALEKQVEIAQKTLDRINEIK